MNQGGEKSRRLPITLSSGEEVVWQGGPDAISFSTSISCDLGELVLVTLGSVSCLIVSWATTGFWAALFISVIVATAMCVSGVKRRNTCNEYFRNITYIITNRRIVIHNRNYGKPHTRNIALPQLVDMEIRKVVGSIKAIYLGVPATTPDDDRGIAPLKYLTQPCLRAFGHATLYNIPNIEDVYDTIHDQFHKSLKGELGRQTDQPRMDGSSDR